MNKINMLQKKQKNMALVFRPIIISFIFLTVTALLLESASSQDLSSMANNCLHSNCSGDGQFEHGSKYQRNLNYLISNLTSKSGSQKFYNFSVGENRNKVYGLYYCYTSIDNELCQDCIQTAANRVLKSCGYSVEAIVWYWYCLLRYANRYIFSTNDVSKYYLLKEGPATYGQYDQQRSHRLISLSDKATSDCSSLVSAASVSVVEGKLHLGVQVECTPDLSKSDCRSCLRTALGRLNTEGHQAAYLFQPSCALGGAFLDRPSSAPAVQQKKLYIGIGVSSGTTAITLIFIIVLIYCLKKRKVTKTPAGIEEIKSMENLHIELDAIKAATCSFSEENILAQGGFGIVYKGILGDGHAIAVKRLSNASKQGIREFKTETSVLRYSTH